MAGKSLNKVTLIGHVGRDPEMKYTPSGVAVANFSLATNERRKVNNDWQDHTEWHRIVAWDKLAEVVNNYGKQGKQLYIEGRLQTRDWTDKDGNKRYTTEIVAQDIILLGGGGGQGGSSSGGYQSSGSSYGGGRSSAPSAQSLPEPDFEPAPTDDLPF